ncbi:MULTISPECIES: hypothetical protein [Mesorhizobium]|uniref:Uncharacterized protein n=1 Tax=Mesorhizobium humile TaxID=3072313 RepID=A0ABU4YJF7_9HYPH|nr:MULTISPECIES: hypothetical protein [unclassified Mesorhizobium]MDX8454063.1 hypothetical protein [Mesorhizobium sp. VK9D]MDX8457301.1 hypothetical protein [Mesorhizobium sp. VK2D]MDX8487094.1 hypothetical protein [Mesorhizobium sp. VK2B]
MPRGTSTEADNPHVVILDHAYFDNLSPVVVQQLALGGLPSSHGAQRDGRGREVARRIDALPRPTPSAAGMCQFY